MDLGLAGKSVLVSGSTRGIGRAIAEAFLREGARVAVTGRDGQQVEAMVRDQRAAFGDQAVTGIAGDLVAPEQAQAAVARTVEAFGRLDCVVSNIGRGAVKFGWDVGESDWEQAFDINLWTGVRLARASIPALRSAGGGSIVFTSALAGQEAVDAPVTYSAAKAALIAFSKNLSREVAPFGIRVNSVAPGNVLFPGGRWEEKLAENREKFTRYIEEAVPMKRFGRPEEIADTVVFVSSERASFMTGECITVDGGQRRGAS